MYSVTGRADAVTTTRSAATKGKKSASAKKIISSITGRMSAIEITQSVATTGKKRKKLAVKGELVSGNINITQRG